MPSKTGELVEGFPTLLAFIVFLWSVNPDMLSEGVEIRKGFPT